jgi:hypothetical protein
MLHFSPMRGEDLADLLAILVQRMGHRSGHLGGQGSIGESGPLLTTPGRIAAIMESRKAKKGQLYT